MLLQINQTTAPASEPISLAQAKQQLVVASTFTDDDALITSLITAARQYAEKYTRRSFFSQQWKLTLDHFPAYIYSGTINPALRRDWAYYAGIWNGMTISLPKGKVTSVDSITFVDITGTTQTLDPSTYSVDLNSLPCRIVPTPGTYWPLNTLYIPGSVAVNYTAASYTSETFPAAIAQAILLLISHWYVNRESASVMSLKEIPFGVTALLDMYRITVLDYESMV